MMKFADSISMEGIEMARKTSRREKRAERRKAESNKTPKNPGNFPPSCRKTGPSSLPTQGQLNWLATGKTAKRRCLPNDDVPRWPGIAGFW